MMPVTPKTLLACLRDGGTKSPLWQQSWRRFVELYHEPITLVARACYRHHTGGGDPPSGLIDDAVATVVAEFFTQGARRYDPAKGRLRTYLRLLVNARVVDFLRKERPLNHEDDSRLVELPPESPEEARAYRDALLLSLIEELRESIPLRQFEIFERVKLKNLPPDTVAAELGVKRGVVDNTVYKVMSKLRELAAAPEYQEEYRA